MVLGGTDGRQKLLPTILHQLGASGEGFPSDAENRISLLVVVSADAPVMTVLLHGRRNAVDRSAADRGVVLVDLGVLSPSVSFSPNN
jgi:hypothetical protein